MNDILKTKAKIWCTRLNKLMKDNNYTQETFLKAYKSKYHGGTQANISRWLRVGNAITKNGVSKSIGFPSYETMLNIADFFGVTIGYLTGETDFETFEMEKACQYLGIDEKSGKALQDLASGKSIELGKYKKEEIKATLKYLLTSNTFPIFINQLQECAANIYSKNHSINCITEVKKKIKKELLELTFQCFEFDFKDFKNNNIEPTEELLETISLLNSAIDQNYSEETANERDVKLSEYELQKIYFELIKDVVSDKHLPEMIIASCKENK